MAVQTDLYGMLDGVTVHGFTIENANGTRVHLIERGATLDRLYYADKNGKMLDLLVGHDALEGYVQRGDYQGVVVGQYANRIGGARFTLDGKEYAVTPNEKGITCLHGGGEYSSAVWHGEAVSDKAVSFTYFSPDLMNGFPGNVHVKVVYTLTDADELRLEYEAQTDRKTVINLTNHAYFNLNGFDGGSVLEHTVQIFADRYTPIDENSIPTGTLEPVKGTPFAFTAPKTIGKDIKEKHPQLKNGNGYDHNFCINGFDGSLRPAAVALGDKSGIRLTVSTTLPGVQFYTGNFLNGTVKGKDGLFMQKRSAFCLETQVYPDSPNHPEWPGCIYDENHPYRSETVFALSRIE